jgi:hypothetical protein
MRLVANKLVAMDFGFADVRGACTGGILGYRRAALLRASGSSARSDLA